MATMQQPRLGIDDAQPVRHGFRFKRSSLAWRPGISEPPALRGTLARNSQTVQWDTALAAGSIELTPNAADWALLIPWILGKQAVDGVYTPGERLLERFIVVDKGASVDCYAGCVVKHALVHASKGGVLQLSLDVVGTSALESAAGSLPALTYSSSDPFQFSNCNFSLLDENVQLFDFTLSIENQLEVTFFGPVAGRLVAVDRMVRFACRCPYDEEYESPSAMPLAGVSASLEFSRVSDMLTFNLPAWQAPPEGPQVPGRDSVIQRLDGIARRTSEFPELIVTIQHEI